jgi:hypothetical protein
MVWSTIMKYSSKIIKYRLPAVNGPAFIIGFVALEDEVVSSGYADTLVLYRFTNPISRLMNIRQHLK